MGSAAGHYNHRGEEADVEDERPQYTLESGRRMVSFVVLVFQMLFVA